MVDLTCIGLGKDVRGLREVAEKTGVNITRYAAIRETKPGPYMNHVLLTTRILTQNWTFKRLKRAFETHNRIQVNKLERLSRF